jgi:hypothetical protein
MKVFSHYLHPYGFSPMWVFFMILKGTGMYEGFSIMLTFIVSLQCKFVLVS